MDTRALRCANCAGAVVFSAGQTLTICEYCGFQNQLDAGAAPAEPPPIAGGVTLASSISIRGKSGQTFPLIMDGTGLPVQSSVTLSNERDNQESITFSLVNGPRDLVEIVLALQARKPRGTVMVQMLVKVDAAGHVTVFLTERGTTNSTKRDGLRVEVQGG